MSKTDFKKITHAYIKDAKLFVVKVGSALLVEEKDDSLKEQWLQSVASDIADLVKRGAGVVVVSSGAIALGRSRLMGGKTRLKLEEKQAAAAIGQIELGSAWRKALGDVGLDTAQILVSLDDTEMRRRHLNARATLQTLLAAKIVPVVNENDTIATIEIRYGDNDRLAARVAQMVSADVLVLLSDIDGIYTEDPRKNKSATHLAEIEAIDDKIMAMAGKANAAYASGGMVTKLEAGSIATQAGCHMVICDGSEGHPLKNLEEGASCSWFRAASDPPHARKKWIAGGLKPKGKLVIDDGAVSALRKGKSLLSAGITSATGNFEKGDLVAICDSEGLEIGRGLSHYSANEVGKIAGSKSDAIGAILGYRGRGEVVHADDLVLR